MKISNVFPGYEKLDDLSPRIEISEEVSFVGTVLSKSYWLTYSVEFTLDEEQLKKTLED